jgi:hypothetical protein
MGAADLLRSAGPGSSRPWGAGPSVMVRPDVRGEAREGDVGGFGRRTRYGKTCSEGAPEGLGPRSRMKRGDQDERMEGPGRRGAVRSEFLRARGARAPGQSDPCGAATRRGLRPKRSSKARNPRNGSGPYGRKAEGEEPVGGVRNAEDGTCRVRQTREKRTLPHASLKGRETPGGEPRSKDRGRDHGECPERAHKPEGVVRTFGSGQAGRRKTSRPWRRRGGSGEPMSPLRRPEADSERRWNPEGRPRGGDVGAVQPGSSQTPGGAIGGPAR